MEIKYWDDSVFDNTKNKLIIRFQINCENDDCTVVPEIYWKESPNDIYKPGPLILNEKLKLHYVFVNNAIIDGLLIWKEGFVPSTIFNNSIWGELTIKCISGSEPWNYQGYFIGFLHGEKLPSPTDYSEPEPIVPEKEDMDYTDIMVSQFSSGYQDLFPYLYLKPWPSVSEANLDNRFIKIPSQVRTSSSFYKKLSDLKKNGDRSTMKQDSVDFIDGKLSGDNADETNDVFISNIECLQSVFKDYLPIGMALRDAVNPDFEFIQVIVINVFGTWDNYISQTKTDQYLADEKNIWASIIALNITLGYRIDLLENFFLLLCTQKVLENSASYSTQENKDENIPTVHLINEWLYSTVILDESIFPLPPENVECKTNTDDKTSPVLPYAIGELQVIKYKLEGYELGEINHIENILKGEIRTSKQRNLKSYQHKELITENNDEATIKKLQNSTSDLVNEVQKTLADKKATTTFNDYKTSYGEPSIQTATISGSWTVEENPAGGETKDVSKFAKDVIDATKKRISKDVNIQRSILALDEKESTNLSKFDNTNGTENIRGIYQWLNKKYSLYTKYLSDHFVIKLKLEDPAKELIANIKNYFGIDVNMPVTPEELKLKSYTDIRVDGEASTTPSSQNDDPLYYLNLFQQFGVNNFPSPPIESLTISRVIKNEKPLSTINQDIPEGYKVESVKVNVVHISDNVSIDIIIGSKKIKYEPTDDNGITEAIEGSFQSLPISILCVKQKETSDKEENLEQVEFVSFYVANIEFLLKRIDASLSNWKLNAFHAINKAYQLQLADYYQQVEHQKAKMINKNPDINEELLRGQIITQSLQVLFNHAKGLNDDNIDEFRYDQFFETSFHWNELQCKLKFEYPDTKFHENIFLKEFEGDIYFQNFLRAKTATILLPVKVNTDRSMLYFLSTGEIWPGTDASCPVINDCIEIYSELKCTKMSAIKKKNKNWSIIIPTSMSVLRSTSEIPKINSL